MSIWSPVRTYPDTLESATFSFRIRLPSTRIRWFRHTNPQLFESALQRGNFWIRHESEIVWTLNPDILLSGDVTRSSLVVYREYCNQDVNFVPRFSRGRARCKFRAHYDACSVASIPRGVLGSRVNRDTCRIRVEGQIRFEYGYVWKWKFLNPERKSCGFKIFGYVRGDILKTLHYSYMLICM